MDLGNKVSVMGTNSCTVRNVTDGNDRVGLFSLKNGVFLKTSSAVIRARNRWCQGPAFCTSGLPCNMFGKRICIFAAEALGLNMNVVCPFALSC